MASKRPTDTMPKFGHVTDMRQQWLERTDGVLAHHLYDREISSHLCENRYRNQQIREDFPVALTEQQIIEQEAMRQAAIKQRQAEIDAQIAREMAEVSMREKNRRRHHRNVADVIEQAPSTSQEHRGPKEKSVIDEIDIKALGLSWQEVAEMKRRLEQEEKDARLARQLSQSDDVADAALVADVRYAVEAQDSELARVLQEKEYHKLQRAKERAKQKARARKQQREAELQAQRNTESNTVLLDAYSNPRDLLQGRKDSYWVSKSMDSDLNYVEPFEKENIQSKQSALQSKEASKQWQQAKLENGQSSKHSMNSIDSANGNLGANHRVPPPVPNPTRKPRFPDPVSIRAASHYPNDGHSNAVFEQNNNPGYNSHDSRTSHELLNDMNDNGNGKRLSVASDITVEAHLKKKGKSDANKKKKSCKIQ